MVFTSVGVQSYFLNRTYSPCCFENFYPICPLHVFINVSHHWKRFVTTDTAHLSPHWQTFVITEKYLSPLAKIRHHWKEICYHWQKFVTTEKKLSPPTKICHHWQKFVATDRYLSPLAKIYQHWQEFVTNDKNCHHWQKFVISDCIEQKEFEK